MLGMAHLEGKGVDKDDRTAYHWLRMAELNSNRVLGQSRCGISELRSWLQSQEIQEQEQQISQKTQEQQKSKLKPAREECTQMFLTCLRQRPKIVKVSPENPGQMVV